MDDLDDLNHLGDQVPAEFAGWSLAWAEEFNGPAGSPADPRTWRPETGGHGWGNSELQYYTGGTANAALDGAGNLAITVTRPDAGLAKPGRIRWYEGQTLYHTVTPADLHGCPWVFDHDFYLLINVAVGGGFSQLPDRSTALPQAMLIDYIRVYATGATAGSNRDATT